MKIGIVCYPTYGGSGVVATELGKELALKGHIVHFITYDRPVRLETFRQNIYFHQVSPPDYPLFEYVPYESALASKVVEVARYESLDLLHVHYAIPHASSAFMAQQILKTLGLRLPFITTLHGTDITLVGKSKAYQPVVTFSINSSDGITSVSDYLKHATLDNFEITKDIKVIHNFIDTEKFKPNPSLRKSIRNCIGCEDEFWLVHASNFRRVKRVNDVVSILYLLKDQLNLRLIMIGDGPDRSSLEERVRSIGLSEKVVFLGNVEGVNEILPAGDLFIMPSENESFGLAALEAMACGMPVIGARAGGLPELVEDGVCGMLSPVGDFEDMAKNTAIILKSRDFLKQFSKNAILRAKQFSKEMIVTQYEMYYQSILNVDNNNIAINSFS